MHKIYAMSQKVEVCFSPILYPHKLIKENFIVVVVDILRASTSICAALHYGIKDIIPVSGSKEAREYKEKGFLVACERNGKTLDFADIGNSPSDFIKQEFLGDTIVFSTTNGTTAINQAKEDSDMVTVGSFINLTALADFLIRQNKNVVILCAAWKHLFNLEDSVMAGALSELLIEAGFSSDCDAAKAAIDLWRNAKSDLGDYLSKSSHRSRLPHLVSDEDYDFTVSVDISKIIPLLVGNRLIPVHQLVNGSGRKGAEVAAKLS